MKILQIYQQHWVRKFYQHILSKYRQISKKGGECVTTPPSTYPRTHSIPPLCTPLHISWETHNPSYHYVKSINIKLLKVKVLLLFFISKFLNISYKNLASVERAKFNYRHYTCIFPSQKHKSLHETKYLDINFLEPDCLTY